MALCRDGFHALTGASATVPAVKPVDAAFPNIMFMWTGPDAIRLGSGQRVGVATCHVNTFRATIHSISLDGQVTLF